MEKLQFEIINKEGKKISCEVIATYHDESVNKDFLVYTDNSYDENQKLNVFYSLYKNISNNIKLIDTTDIKYKKIGLELIKELVNDINN